MQIFRLRAGDEFIRLGQVLKASAIAESGADAKDMIQSGIVSVNGENETRRGRKLYPGDTVYVIGAELQIQAAL